jgi:hypothetical protein
MAPDSYLDEKLIFGPRTQPGAQGRQQRNRPPASSERQSANRSIQENRFSSRAKENNAQFRVNV